MPHVKELGKRLGSAKYLITLDLCKGYWPVPLKPECKELSSKHHLATSSLMSFHLAFMELLLPFKGQLIKFYVVQNTKL